MVTFNNHQFFAQISEDNKIFKIHSAFLYLKGMLSHCTRHGKFPVPIKPTLFAPIPSAARSSSPSYTDSAPLVVQFTACLSRAVVCKHCCWELSVKYITMECLVGN